MTTADKPVYLRCRACGALNRVSLYRLRERPLCGKCKTPLEFPVRPVEATAGTFGKEVFEWPGIVMVEFWSIRCGACALIAPLLEKAANQKAGILKVVKVNIEREPNLAQHFQIRSTPTLLVYRSGRLIDELYGALPVPEMQAWIERAVSS